MKRASTLIALLLLPLLVIAGCSSGGNSSASATGDLSVAATFPSNGQSGNIGAAQLDTNTARIKVEVIPMSGVVWNSTSTSNPYSGYFTFTGQQARNLTPTAPSATFSGLPVGPVYVQITSFDATGKALDQVKASGTILEGGNSLTATLLRGNWTFSQAIAMNKTMSSDTTTISGFGAVSPVGMPNTWYAAYTTIRSNFQQYQQYQQISGWDSPVGMLYHGNFSNYTTGCKGPMIYNPASGYSPVTGWNSATMCGSQAGYVNFFKGTANYNSLDGMDDIELKPDMTYYPKGFWPGDRTNRFAFMMGNYSSPLKPAVTSGIMTETWSTSFSDATVMPAVLNGATRVTGGSAMSGTIIEGLTKWYSSSRRCYNGTTEVTCNQQMYKALSKPVGSKNYQSALATALWKRMAGVGSANADAQGCYRNLQITSKGQYTTPMYTGYDPQTQQPIYTNITIKSTDYETSDVCLNSFTASGAQATTADIGISNQLTEFYFGGQYY